MCEAHEESSGDHAEKVRDTVEEVREDVNETITTALYARESLMELDKVLSSLRRAADELHTLVGPDQIDVSEMIRSNEPLPATLTQTGLQWGRVLDDAEMGLPGTVAVNTGKLQWGRVLDDAEISHECRACRSFSLLQWGRVLDDAEMSLSCQSASPSKCFNGAASWMTRK